MKSLIQENFENNGTINFEPVFKMLNNELLKINELLELVCAGGYVMQLHGYRGTADVDAFYKSNNIIDGIIKKVGDEFGINKPDELWLNNSILNMNPKPPDDYCEIVYQYTNLTVKAVDITYLIGMKLISARGQDFLDVEDIVKNSMNFQPLTLLSKLIDMKFDIDISILLDVFGRANGMEWLDKFYRDNESVLRKYF